jgi:hypothetical protein
MKNMMGGGGGGGAEMLYLFGANTKLNNTETTPEICGVPSYSSSEGRYEALLDAEKRRKVK